MRDGWQMLADGVFVRPADGRVLVRTRWKPMIWQTAGATDRVPGTFQAWTAVCMFDDIPFEQVQARVDAEYPPEAGALAAWANVEALRLDEEIAHEMGRLEDAENEARIARSALADLQARRAAVEAKRGAK